VDYVIWNRGGILKEKWRHYTRAIVSKSGGLDRYTRDITSKTTNISMN
jgi:hypothetical protein